MEDIWEYVTTLTIPANTQSLGFAVHAPAAGRIKRLAVKQLGSSNLVGFTVRVYSRPVIALTPGGSAPDSTAADIVKIMPDITGSAGGAAYFASESEGYAYRNMYSGKLNQPERRIYVQLVLQSAQPVVTNWQLCLVVNKLS